MQKNALTHKTVVARHVPKFLFKVALNLRCAQTSRVRVGAAIDKMEAETFGRRRIPNSPVVRRTRRFFQSNAALVNGVGNTVNGANAFVSRATILGICHGKVPIFFDLIFHSEHAMKGQSEVQHQKNYKDGVKVRFWPR